MARMSEAQKLLMEDTREKAITVRSARNTRTHCGKGGPVRLPSDYMTEKERESMNGECKSYRLNSPMSWDEFKAMPEDIQVIYIKALRQKYNVPNKVLAEMFGVSDSTVSAYFKKLGLSGGVVKNLDWDKDGFMAWWGVVEVDVKEVEAEVEVPVEAEATDELVAVNNEPDIKVEIKLNEDTTNTIDELKREIDELQQWYDDTVGCDDPTECRCCGEVKLATPIRGEMTFEGHIEEIMRTVRNLLEGRNVRLEVKWSLLDLESMN